jgi:organic hydroperoxide reductase OsmC/OhrA
MSASPDPAKLPERPPLMHDEKGGPLMAVMKEMQFPVAVRWRGGRVAHAHSRGKDGLELATPPEFRSGVAGYWTPEDLLVMSAASCFALTLAAVAERHDAPLLDATVTATGHMSRRDDGRFGFTVIEVDASLETTAEGEEAVRRAAAEAESRCLISHALDVPSTSPSRSITSPSRSMQPGRTPASESKSRGLRKQPLGVSAPATEPRTSVPRTCAACGRGDRRRRVVG